MQQGLDETIIAISTRGSWSGEPDNGQNLLNRQYPEMVHRGWALLMDGSYQVLWKTENALQVSSFFRSSAKPFQAVPLLDYGADKRLQPQEIAIACASHSGTQEHLTWVKHLLARQKEAEEPLRCGAHWPVDVDAQRQMWFSQEEMTSLHNNCSGKHAGMLWACEQAGWSKHEYWHPGHPLQRSIFNHISEYGRIAVEDIAVGLDGCGVPTFWLPLIAMARLYIALVSEKKLMPLVDAMCSYPSLVAGPGRVDTAIMEAAQGSLLSKVGADGLICVAHRIKKEAFILKLADGNNAVRDKAVVNLLGQLGWLSGDALAQPVLAPFLDTLRYNTLGQVVGGLAIKLKAGAR